MPVRKGREKERDKEMKRGGKEREKSRERNVKEVKEIWNECPSMRISLCYNLENGGKFLFSR